MSNDTDDTGFWDDMPTSRLERFKSQRPRRARQSVTHPSVGSRQHTDTQQLPVVPARVREAADHVDPLLRRVGVIAVAVALLVPVAMSLRSGTSRAEQGAQGSTLAIGAAPTQSSVAGSPSTAPASTAQRRAASTTAARTRTTKPVAHSISAKATTTAPSTTAATPTTATSAKPHRTTSVAKPATKAPATTTPTSTTTTVRACYLQYTVRSGDAWILIAQRAHVGLARLLKANGATSSTPLYPTRTVCLPYGATAIPAVTHSAPRPSSTSSSSTSTSSAPPAYVPARTYSQAEVVAIIRQVWPDNLEDEAIRIATRESNLIPTARNFCCDGLFQIYYSAHAPWLRTIGVTSAYQLLDPRTNARAALMLYTRSGGFGPWGG